MAGRKLFLTHASELAHLLVTAIAHDALAIKFIRDYAERHSRRKVLANFERLREMERTISREALLLIAAEVRRLLPRAFGLSRSPRPDELALCDAFYAEFLEALGRALEWPLAELDTEAQAFRKDLEIYAGWRERNPEVPPTPKTSRNASRDESPFPDRCAILLDPGMMDQARRAAAVFQFDLLPLGTRIFGQLGRLAPQRRVSTGAKARPARPEGRQRRASNPGVRLRSKPAKSANRPRRRF